MSTTLSVTGLIAEVWRDAAAPELRVGQVIAEAWLTTAAPELQVTAVVAEVWFDNNSMVSASRRRRRAIFME